MNENEYTQLTPGQKFHYKGNNGVVYFKLNVVEQKDGSIFPMTETAPACNIVPLELDAEGNVMALYLMKQSGRPEMGESAVALKSVGAFCKMGESTRECAIRALRDRIALDTQESDLIFCGQSYGFGPQFKFPIDLYVTKVMSELDVPVMDGCERVRMTIEEIAEIHRDRKFFNSETIDLIATILLRNVNRDIYQW